MTPTYTTCHIIPGEKITAYTSTFPSRRYWYRHDRVIVDGVTLEGFIQIRSRDGRVETSTCYKDSCVMGKQVEWLVRQNA
jgi:hypothetical protein